jgi:hypothetical protein
MSEHVAHAMLGIALSRIYRRCVEERSAIICETAAAYKYPGGAEAVDRFSPAAVGPPRCVRAG